MRIAFDARLALIALPAVWLSCSGADLTRPLQPGVEAVGTAAGGEVEAAAAAKVEICYRDRKGNVSLRSVSPKTVVRHIENGGYFPSPETCDGFDNDCDGLEDEEGGPDPDTDPSCASANFIGDLAGDVSEGGARIDNREGWFEVRLVEDNTDANVPLSARFDFSPQPNVNYDLYLYCDCGSLLAESTAGGDATETLFYSQPDQLGNEDVTLFVEVRYVSGEPSCSGWSLNVNTNTETPGFSCND